MALYARRTQGNQLLASEDLLETCFHPIVLLNISCGIEDIFYGSSQCSKLSLATVKEEESYRIASGKCSRNNFVSAVTFQEACANCTSAILDLKETLLNRSEVGDKKNNTERSICAVAAVVSVAAGQSDESGGLAMIDSFNRCLPAALDHDDDFIKIRYYVVKALLAILIAIGMLVFIIVVIKNVTKKKPLKPAKSQVITAWSGLYRFSKAEIEYAMDLDDHHGKVFLGRGSAGNVYKGILPSGQAVAIKHINKSNDYDSFKKEVEGLSRIRHQNLVSLVGFCVEDGEQYLVYEFCPAGNLAQHLLRKDTVLTWETRVRILRDCALALRYLHRYIDGCIVHRDIKLTNILLTEKMEPKLSDFGLAKMLGIEETKVFTDVRGTIGYMDPEYMSNAKLTCASDIYSFGIVALQLLSGQKAVELDLDARDQLTRKAKDVNMGKRPVSDFEDQTLKGNFNKADFQSILQVAVLCVSNTSIGRPNIGVVFDELDKIWKNTFSYKAKQGMSASAMSVSGSLEMISV
ncbi:probable serine/threonine-protein kinase PBL22 [Juglans microcarpa x Juglans regia]|uniref:probable serine/threonine-protein kinase PBL22 n=1 Tax=Juglans microcarpa x Juglans regia TaxID=2249226 RepID=UPI001B7F11AE|nr:probable serine/threonine-protein kinase PBL22 [Juglans microcarpa x Juglans regia]